LIIIVLEPQSGEAATDAATEFLARKTRSFFFVSRRSEERLCYILIALFVVKKRILCHLAE
jgi:hypothetical protein